MTTTDTTVSPVTRVTMEAFPLSNGDVIEMGHDAATVTGSRGTTECTGCFGVSPSGRYRVYFTWKHGAARLGSSTIVEADSGIEAAIKYAVHCNGSLLSCQSGTAEAN